MTIHTADHIAAPLRTVKHRASPIAVPAQMATNTSFHTGAPPQTALQLSTQVSINSIDCKGNGICKLAKPYTLKSVTIDASKRSCQM
uniref:Uncharacterized protein n=1 Tax=Echinococcus granulosus TaxID=6210 RepID=A0A068WYH5_ECHGR|nr:hypothetical protein EgrG_000409000 [Echinococcus granulosus]